MAQVIDGVYYNGAAIDGLIEDLEGAYDDLTASDSAMGAAFDAYELAKKRVAEDSAKVAQLREKLAQVYPSTKGMAWDWAIGFAKEQRGAA